MSRKSKVSLEEKKKWSRPRMDIASLGYSFWKLPADSMIKNTLVFIEHKADEQGSDDIHHVARMMRSSARAILINPDRFEAAASTHK